MKNGYFSEVENSENKCLTYQSEVEGDYQVCWLNLKQSRYPLVRGPYLSAILMNKITLV